MPVPLSPANVFRVASIRHRYLCHLPLQKCFQKQQFHREMVYGFCNSQHFGFCLLNVQFSVMNQIEILNIYINVSALMVCAGNTVQCLVNIVHYLYTFVGNVGN